MIIVLIPAVRCGRWMARQWRALRPAPDLWTQIRPTIPAFPIPMRWEPYITLRRQVRKRYLWQMISVRFSMRTRRKPFRRQQQSLSGTMWLRRSETGRMHILMHLRIRTARWFRRWQALQWRRRTRKSTSCPGTLSLWHPDTGLSGARLQLQLMRRRLRTKRGLLIQRLTPRIRTARSIWTMFMLRYPEKTQTEIRCSEQTESRLWIRWRMFISESGLWQTGMIRWELLSRKL